MIISIIPRTSKDTNQDCCKNGRPSNTLVKYKRSKYIQDHHENKAEKIPNRGQGRAVLESKETITSASIKWS